MMNSVLFTFSETASEQVQNALGDRLMREQGVHNVGRISPDAKRPALRRMWYAEVADEKTAMNVVRKLNQLTEIESAALPAERGIIA
jgi:hypothetical protein